MIDIGAIYVLHGDRDIRFLMQSVRELRKFCPDIPVIVYYHLEDRGLLDVLRSVLPENNIEFKEYAPLEFEDTKDRAPHRNSDIQRTKALINSSFENTVYIDNDVYVVHRGFLEGFRISDKFGCAMAMNPRWYASTMEGDSGDLDIGADVSEYDRAQVAKMPKYMTAVNIGLIFYNKSSHDFMEAFLSEQEKHPSRGQAAIIRAMWATGKYPFILPPNWLACSKHETIEKPIALHVGHENILKLWQDNFSNYSR